MSRVPRSYFDDALGRGPAELPGEREAGLEACHRCRADRDADSDFFGEMDDGGNEWPLCPECYDPEFGRTQ